MSAEYDVHLQSLSHLFSVYELPRQDRPESLFLRVYRDATTLSCCIRECKPEHVFIISADGKAQALGLLKFLSRLRLPEDLILEGILLRGSGAYTETSIIRRSCRRLSLFALRLSPIDMLHFIDPLAYEWITEHHKQLSKRASLLGDPIEPMISSDSKKARQQLGLPVDGQYIGTAGALNPRKGVALLTKAFSLAREERKKARLLLAGKQAPSVRDFVDEHQRRHGIENIISIDRYLTNEEFRLALCALDVVCVPYPRHRGSSGILLSAGSLGKPVLASDYGWVGATTQHFHLGRTVDVSNTTVFAKAIVESLDDADLFTPNRIWTEYQEQLTPTMFVNSLTRILRERQLNKTLR